MNWDRLVLRAGAAVAVFALAATLWILGAELGQEKTLSGPGLVASAADRSGPFALTDHEGTAVTQARYAGQVTLVTFGYSHCPDFCPTTLQTMALALESLGPKHEAVGGLFVSVDPERDTPAHLADYVPHFHEGLTGLTGAKQAIDALTRAFGVIYTIRKDIDPVDYPVDHSTFTYVMDGDWKLRAVLRHDATPDQMAAAVERIL